MQRESEGLALHPGALAPVDEISEDKELVLAFKRGEDGSYQAIYERYSARIGGICRRMLQQSHDAEEAQQETLMRVYTGLSNFNGRYQLGAWVSRIATNVCLDHIRAKGRKPADSTDQAALVDLSDDQSDGPEEIFMKGDERHRVREVLTELAPMHRAALALREFEGMSYSDIAVALGMTEPQVKALIHRARRSFKKRWAHGLALLLPWRLLARFRRFSHHYDAPTQFADAAASTANLASSCSAVLHQCGAFVTDKAATAFTAMVVGTAAMGTVVTPVDHAPAKPTPRVEAKAVQASVTNRPPKEPTREKPKKPEPPRAALVPTTTEPAPESSPAPKEEPSPSPEDGEPTEDGETEKTPPPAGPAPLYTYFGWDRGQPIPRAQATTRTQSIDCTGRSLAHTVETLINDGAFSYRAVFKIYAASTSTRFEFSVWKDGSEYQYSSWGASPVTEWVIEGNEARLEITGDYGAIFGYDPASAELPTSGHFDATLTLDCAAQTVVTEGAVLTAE